MTVSLWRQAAAWRLGTVCRPPLLAGAAAIVLLCAGLGPPPRPRLLWNASASAPVGLYRIHPPTHLRTGDMVVAWLPAQARELAAGRHYLPRNVPILKRIAAEAGDRVCAAGDEVRVNETGLVWRARRDRSGRALPAWSGCRLLEPGQYFLLMEAAGSFDGRYFGLTMADQIVGEAVPLWID